MQCGKPLGTALTILPATPDPDLCPLCSQKSSRVKTAFHDLPPDLAQELAPPRKPLPLRLFGTQSDQTIDGFPRVAARGKLTLPSLVVSASASGYTIVLWALGALTLALLLLAMNKVGSYKDLPSAVQNAQNVGAVIASRVAASLPYLLGMLGSLAAAVGLVAIKTMVDKLWKDPVIAYQKALTKWDSAYYCATDRIVFIRTVTAVHWDPVEELQRLISRD